MMYRQAGGAVEIVDHRGVNSTINRKNNTKQLSLDIDLSQYVELQAARYAEMKGESFHFCFVILDQDISCSRK